MGNKFQTLHKACIPMPSIEGTFRKDIPSILSARAAPGSQTEDSSRSGNSFIVHWSPRWPDTLLSIPMLGVLWAGEGVLWENTRKLKRLTFYSLIKRTRLRTCTAVWETLPLCHKLHILRIGLKIRTESSRADDCKENKIMSCHILKDPSKMNQAKSGI